MELLIALAGFLAGGIIGSMMQFWIGKRSIQRYAAALLIDTNEQQRLRIAEMERKSGEREEEILKLRQRILELEARLSEIEKHQNGKK